MSSDLYVLIQKCPIKIVKKTLGAMLARLVLARKLKSTRKRLTQISRIKM